MTVAIYVWTRRTYLSTYITRRRNTKEKAKAKNLNEGQFIDEAVD